MHTEMTDSNVSPLPRGWVLYDGDCAFCTRLAARWHSTVRAAGFQLEPLQSAWVRRRLNLPEEKLLSQMHVLTREGRVLGGADALVYLASEVDWRRRPWWAWLLFIAGKLPLALPILRSAYGWIAARRYCRQGICTIPNARIAEKEGIR